MADPIPFRRPPAILDTFGRPGPAARVVASHRLVEQASRELATADPGSGVKSLVFAAATHLALTIGADDAKAFFEMIAGCAGQIRPEGDPAA